MAEPRASDPPAIAPARASRRLAVTFGLGFSSGLPLALSSGTLTYFLSKYGVSVETVGLFGVVSVPYTYKFLWAPILDRVDPFPFAGLGRRRGWLLLTQLGLFVSILGTAFSDPARSPLATALGAFAIACSSASQDIVVDALRVESLEAKNQGWGAALTQWGYRIGMLVSGFLALHMADRVSFRTVYLAMAGLCLLGPLATLLAIEPAVARTAEEGTFGDVIVRAIVAPFRSLAARLPLALVVLFLLVYRLGDAWAGQMTNPYLVATGFTGGEIANVTKLFGTIATVVGVAIGGMIVSRVSASRSLPFAVVIMAVSNLGYAWLTTRGHSTLALTIAVSVENVTSGIGGSIAIAWMSSLCEPGKAATQYALLSALTSMSRTHLVVASGFVKAFLDHSVGGGSSWPLYFLVTVFAGVPGIALAILLARRSPEQGLEQRQQA